MSRIGWSADRWAFLLSTTAAFLVLGVLARPIVQGEIYYQNDLQDMHLAYRAFYAGCLERGDRFEWCPSLHGGYYLHGEGQAGMYHPLHLFLYRTLPLAPALDLEILSGYAFACAGTFLFLRRWRLGRGSSSFGAFLFGLSGFNLLHLTHVNAVGVVGHLPWLLLAIDVSIRTSSRRPRALAGAAIALLTGSQFLLGYPQYVYFSALAEVAYAVAVAWSSGRGRRLFAFGWHKAVGVMVGGVQLLPTLDVLRASTRGAPDEGFGSFFSLHPVNLLQLVAPYFFRERAHAGYTHEMGLYGGAVALVLAAWLWSRRADLGARRPLAAFALALGGLGLVLALGGYSGPFYRAWTAIPGLGLFRCPCRHIVLVHLALAIAAALGLEALAAGRPDDRRGRGLVAALPVAALLVAALALWSKFHPHVASGTRIAIGPVLVAAAAALVVVAARGSRAAFVAAVLLGIADPAAYGLTYMWRYPPAKPLAEVVAGEPAPPSVSDGRVESSRTLLTLSGHRLTRGYVGLPPETKVSPRSEAGLRLAGVDWIAEDGPERSFASFEGGLPRFRLVAEAVRSEAPWAGLDEVDLARIATVRETVALDPGPSGEVTVLEDRPGEMRLRTAADGRRLLVVSERWDPGWRVEVDGRPTRVLAAYGEWLACEVPPGEHEVHLVFDPRSLRDGRLATLAGLFLALVALARGASRP